jgi:hypothetical protein
VGFGFILGHYKSAKAPTTTADDNAPRAAASLSPHSD